MRHKKIGTKGYPTYVCCGFGFHPKAQGTSVFSQTLIYKVWIQHDGTEGGIANELIEQGVSKKDIVLGFHAPFKRQFTEFAVF